MKRPEPSMFRDVPESERPVGEPIGVIANRLLAKIDAQRREFQAMQARNEARIRANEKILQGDRP